MRPREIMQFAELLRTHCPSAKASIDEPRDPQGEWWIDVRDGRFRTSLSWMSERGFGVFTSDEEGFGERPDELYSKPSDVIRRICQLRSRWEDSKQVAPMHLKDLRELVGTQQVAVAAAMRVKQAAVSRFENRGNIQIESLSAYIEAMGGELELRAKFKDFEARIEPATPATPKVRREK